MKNFALQPISVQAKSQSLVFILCNLYQIAEAELDLMVVDSQYS